MSSLRDQLDEIVARRRTALDGAGSPPQLRATADPAGRDRRLLAAKRAGEDAVSETSADLEWFIFNTGPGSSAEDRTSIFATRGPWPDRVSTIFAVIMVVILIPRLLGTGMTALAFGLGNALIFIVGIAFLLMVWRRWLVDRRLEIGAELVPAALAQLQSDSRRRLRAIIDEWLRIDDTLGIGTALESAYSRETQTPDLDRARQSIIDSVDDALAEGHDALDALDAEWITHRGVQSVLLERIDAADRAFLRLRLYRRALDD